MREVRLQAIVDEDHIAHLQLPDDVPEGSIEVIVRVDECPKLVPEEFLGEFLNRLATRPWPGRSKEDIDRQIHEERDSWD
jgi:hypothetical protein